MTINRPFGDCKIDELHLADAIQAFGAMVVVDGDDRIIAASANSEAFLGQPPQALLGTDARVTLPASLDLQAARAQDDGTQAGPARQHLEEVEVDGRPLVASVHVKDGNVFVELEQPGTDARSDIVSDTVQRVAYGLAETWAPVDAARHLLDGIADLVGFDRVMLYRFLPGWSGEVLDERLAPGTSGFVGLRFPEGDIPANARRLYEKKRQRIIADARAETVPVLGVRDGMRLDLTRSELRAVHPTHLEYLANMGVIASFSVSIVVDGHLWGMVACHHFAPRGLGFATRRACELLATVASLHIEGLERMERLRASARHIGARERARFDVERSGGARLADTLPRLREAFRADGAMGHIGRSTCTDGDVPTGATAERVSAWCHARSEDGVTAVSQVPNEVKDDPEAVRTASGILHVPLGGTRSLTLLRREQVEDIAWAGRPPDDEMSKDASLGPRTSFAIWREETRGRSERWSEADVEAAEELRAALIEGMAYAEVKRRASTDLLTGLANRSTFESTLRDVLRTTRRTGVAVLIVDLDEFKPVNDRFGHPAGDRLLEQVAERLAAALREGDVAARLGGDEFGVLLRRVTDTEALAAAASRVVRELGAPYDVDGRTIQVGASVGAAFASERDETPRSVVERADRAMYAAKRAGRGLHVIADDRSDGGDEAGPGPR